MKTYFFQWFSAVAVLTVVVIVIIVAVVLTSGKTPLTLLFLKEFEFFKSFIEDLINGLEFSLLPFPLKGFNIDKSRKWF